MRALSPRCRPALHNVRIVRFATCHLAAPLVRITRFVDLTTMNPTGHSDRGAAPDFSKGTDGLLPAIAQDADDGTVLMLAWMNEEAFRATLKTGRATYYSRSRKSLWQKGDTSGHTQQVVEVRFDCDADAILLRVHQVGAACHENYRSCFFRTISGDGDVTVNQAKLD